MKIRFQLKGMMVEVKELPNGLIITIETVTKLPPAQGATVSSPLEQRINACTTLTELLHLLFTTTEKTEAVMALFDLKMEALEQEGFSIYQSFKTNNNGSTSFGKLA